MFFYSQDWTLGVLLLLLSCNVSMVTAETRELPDGYLLIGQASDCVDQQVATAIRNGVNVVVWSTETDFGTTQQKKNISLRRSLYEHDLSTSFNLKCIQNEIEKMDKAGFSNVVHLLGIGGRNKRQLTSTSSMKAEELYARWYDVAGDIFHGISWVFDRFDDVESPDNFYSKEDLDLIGQMSRLAKQDGYIVSISAPQSFLDFSSTKFSQYVNNSNLYRDWHSNESHYGMNLCAYLLKRFGESIDYVSVNLYESYSRASHALTNLGVSPVTYLRNYAKDLALRKGKFQVDFDENLLMPSKEVSMPLSKLVIGLANGWADGEEHIYISPQEVAQAFNKSEAIPRGFMVYSIDEEGKDGLYFVEGLYNVLQNYNR